MSAGRKILQLEEDLRKLQNVVNELVEENYHLKCLLTDAETQPKRNMFNELMAGITEMSEQRQNQRY